MSIKIIDIVFFLPEQVMVQSSADKGGMKGDFIALNNAADEAEIDNRRLQFSQSK